MENMAYIVVMASRKLHYYFQSHKTKVPTLFPLRDMFENKEAYRKGKWATKLAEHTIDFVPQNSNQVPGLGRVHCRLDSSGAFVRNTEVRINMAA